MVYYIFNPVKSKLPCFNYVSSDKPYITLYRKPADVVDNDLHLGNRIDNTNVVCMLIVQNLRYRILSTQQSNATQF